MNIHLQVFVGYLSILLDKHLGSESPSHLGLATWSFIKSCWAGFQSGLPLSAFQAGNVHAFQRLHPHRCEGCHPCGFHLHFPWSQMTGSIFSHAYQPHVYLLPLSSARFPHSSPWARSPAHPLQTSLFRLWFPAIPSKSMNWLFISVCSLGEDGSTSIVSCINLKNVQSSSF